MSYSRLRRIVLFVSVLFVVFFSSCKKEEALFYDDSFKSNFDYLFSLVGKDYEEVKSILAEHGFYGSWGEFDVTEEEFLSRFSRTYDKDDPFYPFPIDVIFKSSQYRDDRPNYFEFWIDEDKKVENLTYNVGYLGAKLQTTSILEMCSTLYAYFPLWDSFESYVQDIPGTLDPFVDSSTSISSFAFFIDSLQSYPSDQSYMATLGLKKGEYLYSCLFVCASVTDLTIEDIAEMREEGLNIRNDAWACSTIVNIEKEIERKDPTSQNAPPYFHRNLKKSTGFFTK